MKKGLTWFLSLLMLSMSFITANAQQEDFPQISSDYVYMVDLDTNQVMVDEGSEEIIYPASMTKMMTLLVAIENAPDLDQTMVLEAEVFEGLAEAHASVAGFSLGETVTVRDLLYGLFLPSGADASRALALLEAGSEEAFVAMMNDKAAQLGMEDTHFVNTSGLHDRNHVTTLRDLEKLMRYALQNETFVQIFQTRRYTATPSMHPEGLVWESTLFSRISSGEVDNDTILGGKTGYTNPAGQCLASIAEQDGTRYLLITAHAPVSSTPYHIQDADLLYDYFFEHYTKTPVISEGEVLLEDKVRYVLFSDTLTLSSEEAIVLNLPKNFDRSQLQVKVTLTQPLEAPISEGQPIATLQLYRTDGEQPQLLLSRTLNSPRTYRRSALLVGIDQVLQWIRSHLAVTFLGALAVVLCLILLRDWHREQRRYRTPRPAKKRRPHL